MTEVTLDNITKRFGSETAIEDVSLTVRDGEVLSIVGPSGCGKSTTLRTVAGFETPTEGRIMFDETDVTDVRAENRNVGLVFQDYALFMNMSVMENATFGPRMKGVPKEEREAKAMELLELVGIEELADRDPASLSGGQQQRVALVRALAVEPEILLLDEPMTGLDAKLKKRLRREIGQLLTDIGVTTLYVTHDQTQAMAMADRVAVLNDGRIEQIGTPETVYEQPANPFVANFIGTSNLLPATANGEAVDLGFATVEVDELPTTDGDVTVVTRPDDFTLNGGPIQADVLDTFYIGGTVQMIVELPDGNQISLNVNPKQSDVTGVGPGDQVGLSLDASNVHVVS
ncbi:ABC transporter ATP-binding protein [Natrarchaeobius halalkaliphilus]|uniref:Molybdate/tungstate import ATP-binding protein WtpC n=1 Tax=Natrarchaeobius halalkaliphilus TaxID=1679091 RepID=A0A3N6MBZ4_9EURY|nr:ABC transporter ATP-binding protein [Natrarchaeobius halalkaliphilus]RQG93001.1 ABC transporter ATP-binding protein [Natrarchaeobius halalkaliphilus]